jgi:hypothetical protein
MTRQPHDAAADVSQETEMATKLTKKTSAPKAKGPGVIATVMDTISRDKGATAEAIVAVLVKAFPDRKPDGMRKTVIIQANKNCTSKETDEKRVGSITAGVARLRPDQSSNLSFRGELGPAFLFNRDNRRARTFQLPLAIQSHL